MKSLLIALTLLFASGAQAATPLDNADLAQLFQQDQAERESDKIDWSQLAAHDATRKARVQALLDAGSVHTATDYYHAAMVFQHGESLMDYRLANALATVAMALDKDNAHYRWLVAASWDRLLMHQLQPQWYGTQFKGDAKGMYLYPTAVDAVSEAERKTMVGHTLAESRAHVPDAARDMGLPVRAPAPTIDALRQEAAAANVDAKATSATQASVKHAGVDESAGEQETH